MTPINISALILKNKVTLKVLVCLIKNLDILASSWPADKKRYLDKYREACITTGTRVSVNNLAGDNSRTGKAVKINEDFSLQVLFDDTDTEERINSGEVSVRGLYGYT